MSANPSFPCLASLPADYAKTGCHVFHFVDAAHVERAARHYLNAGFFIEDVCGLETSDGFEVVYHFDRFGPSAREAVRVLVPLDKPQVPSIAHIFPGAEWHERETTDFYGITFVGNPNPKALLLADDAGVHPLRKDDKSRQPCGKLFAIHRLAEPEPPAAEAAAEAPAEGAGDADAKAKAKAAALAKAAAKKAAAQAEG